MGYHRQLQLQYTASAKDAFQSAFTIRRQPDETLPPPNQDMVRVAAFPLLAAASAIALAQNSDPLVDQTIKAGGFAETITTFCTQRNARGAQQYQAALSEWKQRNHWEAISAKAEPGKIDEASASATQALRKQGNKAVVLCLDLRKTLSTSTFDPSQQHAQELAQLADGGAASAAPAATQAAQPKQTQPATPTEAAPPPPLPPAAGNTAPIAPSTIASVPGGPGQVGDASFTVPATWRPGKATASEALYQRPTKDKGEVQIIVFEQKPMQGDFKTSFAAIVRGLFPGKTPELKYIYPAMTRTGLPAFHVRDGSQLRSGKSAALRAVGMQLPGNQVFVIMLLSTDHYGGLYDAEKELTAVVSSLTFRTQNGVLPWNPLVNRGSGNATGLYWYTTLTNTPNAFGGMDMRAERKYVVLLPEGRAYRDLPDGGHVLDMDFTSLCRDPKKMSNCGSYDLQGSTVKFRWPDDFGLMAESTGSYIAGRSLESEGNKYNYAAPVNGDLKLNGRYRSFFASVGQTAFTSNAVSSEKFITFTPDGRYQKQGFTGASFSNTGAQGTVGSKHAPSQGTYRISGYTMVLQPMNGSPEGYTVVFEEQSQHPGAVFIDDEAYLGK